MRVLTDKEEDDPPPPAPLSQPSRPASTSETLSLWLRRHPPSLLLPDCRSPPGHHDGISSCLAAEAWQLAPA
uniref:Uncharacterized protein n=1 Tax=Oryza brachyantha TaxID=4533 RepID=J3MQU5_ORYBR